MTTSSHARRLPLLACYLLAACGGGKSTGNNTTTAHDLSAAAPLIAVASPVASKSSATTHQALRVRSSTADTSPGAAAPQAKSLPDQIAAIRTRLAQTTVDACLQGIQLQAPQVYTSCYGPSLAYLNHPNYSGGPSGMAGGCSIVSDDGDDGCLPSGDLGIWKATEPTGEACTAATMNAKVLSVSAIVNSAVDLMAGLICVAQVNGSDLTVGTAALDLHDTVNAKLSTQLTTASLQRLADRSDGRATYRISVAGTVGQTPVSVTAVHSPGDSTGNGSAGLLNGYIDHIDGMNQQPYRDAFSVLYEIAGGKVRFELRSGNTSTSVGASALFAADGTFDFAAQLRRPQGAGMAAGGTLDRAEIDASTGLGTLIHAWQAGNGDQFTRVFQATTSAGVSGPDTGYGYFGFGPPLDSPQLGSIAGMFCNWAGPGAVFHQWTNGVANVNTLNVQAQSMTRDATSGVFVPTGEDHITYAPTNSCDASSTTFRYKEFAQTGSPTNSEVEATTAANVTNMLVSQGALGAIPDVAAPAAYIVP